MVDVPCKVCGTIFTRTRNRVTCSSVCSEINDRNSRRKAVRKYHAKRWREDPEFRAYQNEWRRRAWANDSSYRERVRASNREYMRRKRTDPEWYEAEKARQREVYHRRKRDSAARIGRTDVSD